MIMSARTKVDREHVSCSGSRSSGRRSRIVDEAAQRPAEDRVDDRQHEDDDDDRRARQRPPAALRRAVREPQEQQGASRRNQAGSHSQSATHDRNMPPGSDPGSHTIAVARPGVGQRVQRDRDADEAHQPADGDGCPGGRSRARRGPGSTSANTVAMPTRCSRSGRSCVGGDHARGDERRRSRPRRAPRRGASSQPHRHVGRVHGLGDDGLQLGGERVERRPRRAGGCRTPRPCAARRTRCGRSGGRRARWMRVRAGRNSAATASVLPAIARSLELGSASAAGAGRCRCRRRRGPPSACRRSASA